MSTDFATVLDECLDRLKAGDSVAACLERYPEHANELKSLLETVQFTHALRFTEPPRPQALARGRQRFLTEAARLREERSVSGRSLLSRLRDFFTAGAPTPAWGRIAAMVVVALLLFGTVSGVVVQASETSLPGDTLYPIKQVTRQVQLITTLNPKAREEKEKQIQAQERVEVRQATAAGRVFEEDVAGVIIDWQGSALVLENGLYIRLTNTTEIQGQPAAGLIAEVHVRSEDGRLLAEQIRVREQSPTGLVMAATETATVTLTATPEPTQTPLPTETNTPEPTKRPTKKVVPTDTPTPKPKVTDTPFPTVTAAVGPSVHVFELRGPIDSISEFTWVVAGQEIQIAPDTVIKGEPAVGRMAHVRANRLDDGTFVAVEIDIEIPDTPTPAKVFLSGIVESKERETVWHIGGRRVRFDDRSKIEGELRIGAFAEVEGLQESLTTVFAQRITIVRACENPVPFEGTILSINTEAGIWIVEVLVNANGQTIAQQFTVIIDSETQIQNAPVIGAVAQIESCQTGDTYLARRIYVVPTPTPTDTPTITPTLEPPALQSTPTVGLAVTVTPPPEVQETPTPTVKPSPTATGTSLPNDVLPTSTP